MSWADMEKSTLPKDFRDAARVGQVTQDLAQQACQTSETALNKRMGEIRGDNKFAPSQTLSFNCGQAVVRINKPAAP
jgi:hypothetical protein